jgi:hypothetical protein
MLEASETKAGMREPEIPEGSGAGDWANAAENAASKLQNIIIL